MFGACRVWEFVLLPDLCFCLMFVGCALCIFSFGMWCLYAFRMVGVVFAVYGVSCVFAFLKIASPPSVNSIQLILSCSECMIECFC